MNLLLQILNKPIDAFRAGNKWIAWGLVAFTIFVNTVFEPLLRFFFGVIHQKTDLLHILKTSVLGICTYIVICAIFYFVSKCFGSKTKLGIYLNTWGLTYFPTIICSFVVAFTEVFFYVFWNNVLWGMVFGCLFVGILLWKIILYVLFLREVAGLKRGKMIGAFIITGVFIILLAMGNGYVGLKTPVL